MGGGGIFICVDLTFEKIKHSKARFNFICYELNTNLSLQINTPPFQNQPPNITYTKPQYVEGMFIKTL